MYLCSILVSMEDTQSNCGKKTFISRIEIVPEDVVRILEVAVPIRKVSVILPTFSKSVTRCADVADWGNIVNTLDD